MKVHHLNCGSFCPLLGGEAVCHCLVLETAAHGLVLIDTGIGHHVSEDPRRRMSRMNRWTLRPRFALEESALTQLDALGFSPDDDVRHVVVTHLAARVTSALPAARRENLERLRELRRTQEIVSVFSAHSPEEYRALSAGAGTR